LELASIGIALGVRIFYLGVLGVSENPHTLSMFYDVKGRLLYSHTAPEYRMQPSVYDSIMIS